MRWLLLLLVPTVTASPMLVGVAPDLPGALPADEGIAVWSDEPLVGYSLSDGEGTWRIPDLGPGTHWFVGDADTWAAFDGPPPSGEWGDALRLGNDGDDIELIGDGVVDTFRYGDKGGGTWGQIGKSSPGLLYQRIHDDGFVDTDTAADWRTPREHRIGETDIAPRTFQVDALTLYASPDSSFSVVTGLIDSASERLHLHVYELRSQVLVDRLVAAAQRGVDVQVLVTARPVGQDAWERSETADGLRRIEAAGGEAWLAGSGRYRYHHLKVLVADDAVAVQSENWVASGIPADPSWGNRGWGVVAHDMAMADWFADWMAADRGAWDTEPFELDAYDPTFAEPPRFSTPTGTHAGHTPAITIQGPVEVTPVITPDHTQDPRRDPTLLAAVSAEERLWAQQLDVSRGWENDLGWSAPDGLREALRDGPADTRIMAAAPFRHDDTGNADAIATLPADGVMTCTFAVPDLVLHNKGLIADDTVYVGSMNGNHHSRAQNREVGLLIDDPRAADYYGDLFMADWSYCDEPMLTVPSPVPTLFLLALAVRLRRWSPPSP